MRNLTLEEVKSNVKGKMAVLCSMFCETQPLVSIIPVTRVSNERGEALSEKLTYPATSTIRHGYYCGNHNGIH